MVRSCSNIRLALHSAPYGCRQHADESWLQLILRSASVLLLFPIITPFYRPSRRSWGHLPLGNCLLDMFRKHTPVTLYLSDLRLFTHFSVSLSARL